MFPASQKSLPKCRKKSESGEGGERTLDDCDRAGLVLWCWSQDTVEDGRSSQHSRQALTRVHVVRQLVPCTSAVHESATVSKFSTSVAPGRNSMCEDPPDQPAVSVRIAWRTPTPSQLCSQVTHVPGLLSSTLLLCVVSVVCLELAFIVWCL